MMLQMVCGSARSPSSEEESQWLVGSGGGPASSSGGAVSATGERSLTIRGGLYTEEMTTQPTNANAAGANAASADSAEHDLIDSTADATLLAQFHEEAISQVSFGFSPFRLFRIIFQSNAMWPLRPLWISFFSSFLSLLSLSFYYFYFYYFYIIFTFKLTVKLFSMMDVLPFQFYQEVKTRDVTTHFACRKKTVKLALWCWVYDTCKHYCYLYKFVAKGLILSLLEFNIDSIIGYDHKIS